MMLQHTGDRQGFLPLTQNMDGPCGTRPASDISLEKQPGGVMFTNLLNFKRYCLCLFFFLLILVHLLIKIKQVCRDVRFTLWICHSGSGGSTATFSTLSNLKEKARIWTYTKHLTLKLPSNSQKLQENCRTTRWPMLD